MLHRLNFITGIVMLVVAGTLVFVVTRHEAPAAAGKEAHAPERKAREAAAGQKWPRTAHRVSRADADGDQVRFAPGSAATGVRMLKAGELRSDLRVLVDRLRYGDLEESAQHVEAFAMRRLGMLTEQLDLTAEQQARIFPILVRTSQSYDPRMRVVSGSHARPLTPEVETSSGSALDKSQEQALVQKELSPTQSDELADQSIRDLLLWEEIIDGLTYQLDQATPGQVDEVADGGPVQDVAVPVAEPVVPPVESHGGRNLFGP